MLAKDATQEKCSFSATLSTLQRFLGMDPLLEAKQISDKIMPLFN
jgi:hypothetical protein